LPITAISFDLWDTIVVDDSDESVRSALGLRSKHDERRHLIHIALPHRRFDDVVAAVDAVDVEFRHAWKVDYINWTVEYRLGRVFDRLGEATDAPAFATAVEGWETMEVDLPPRLIDGAAEAIAELAGRYKLAICSDAIVTPGSGLRRLLENHGVKQFFSSFAYSDEVGRSKPHRSMFDTAAEGLGVPVEQMVHIGDRHSNDIDGPHALGMKAVLFTASRAVDEPGNSADAVCSRYPDLPAIIDRLAGASA
jgi:HAD superfamily hydrolase (TIGR01549 family)